MKAFFLLISFFSFLALCNSQCEIGKKYDKFEDKTTYLTYETRVCKLTQAPIDYTFFQFVLLDETVYLAIKDRTNKVQSTFNEGRVIILFKDGSKMSIQSSTKALSKTDRMLIADTNIWVNLLTCPLSLKETQLLSDKQIASVRIKYDNYNKDFDLAKKPSKLICQYVKCLTDLLE